MRRLLGFPLLLSLPLSALPLTGCDNACTLIGVEVGLHAEVDAGDLEAGEYAILARATGEPDVGEFEFAVTCTIEGESSGQIACEPQGAAEEGRSLEMVHGDPGQVWISVRLPNDFPTGLSIEVDRDGQDYGGAEFTDIEYRLEQPNGPDCDPDDQFVASVSGELELVD